MRYRAQGQRIFNYPAQADPRVRTGLVYHYMGEGTHGGGQEILDSSGNRNHGTLAGTLQRPYTLGIGGKRHAIYIHDPGGGGALTKINLTNGVSIASSANFTYAMWLRADTWGGTNPGIWRDGASSTGGTFNIFQSNTGRPWIRLNTVDVLKPLSGYAVPLNDWTHIAYVVRSSVDASFYANGALQHTATHSTATPAFTINVLGIQTDDGQFAGGIWDDIRIYNRALTEVEIMTLASPAFNSVRNILARYYDAVAGPATSVKDLIMTGFIPFAR